MNDLYKYGADLLAVTDGDTYKVAIYARGFEIDGKRRVRLARINCPEISKAKTAEEKERGLAAKQFAIGFLQGKEIVIQPTLEQENPIDDFGRIIAEVYVREGSSEINMNDYLVEQGHAIYKKY